MRPVRPTATDGSEGHQDRQGEDQLLLNKRRLIDLCLVLRTHRRSLTRRIRWNQRHGEMDGTQQTMASQLQQILIKGRKTERNLIRDFTHGLCTSKKPNIIRTRRNRMSLVWGVD